MQPENRQAIFSQTYRVYYEDTDAGGVIYHSNYLKFMERVRTEWLRVLGFSQYEMAKQQILFVVHSLTMRYIMPGRLDDELLVTATIKELKRASLVFFQQVRRLVDDVLLCEGEIKVTSINSSTFKSIALPKNFAEKFALGQ